ncbi:hypothetical protein AB3S75_031436 [Citrus x aurantiifolia]
MTPFQALYGRLPPTIPGYSKGSTSIQALEDLLVERDELLRGLRANLCQAQHRMAQKANKHRRDLQLQVGDKVLVHLQPYRQSSTANRASHKLAKRYYGPFRVLERIGSVACKLELPAGSKIHHVFHISLLKPYVGDSHVDIHSLPPASVNNKPLSSPIAICAERSVLKQGQELRQVLVQWSDCAPENSTWEDYDDFCKTYTELHLEDKVNSQGMGNDTTLPETNDKSTLETEEETQLVEEPIKGPARMRRAPTYLKDYIT